jgi:hypothetical protein
LRNTLACKVFRPRSAPRRDIIRADEADDPFWSIHECDRRELQDALAGVTVGGLTGRTVVGDRRGCDDVPRFSDWTNS